MRIWRVLSPKHASTAYSGEGARKYGARWNNVGVPMVYTSTSLALASVEVFVNIDLQTDPLPLVAVPAEIPDELLRERVEERELPESWREIPSVTCIARGGEWFASRRSVALMVPSAAVMHEWNVLLNPEHPDFARLTIGEPQPFRFDSRMFRRA